MNFSSLLASAGMYPLLVGLRVNTDLLTALANVTSQLCEDRFFFVCF